MSGGPGNMWTEHRLANGHRFFETTQAMPGQGTMRAVRYGMGLSGVVDHPMKSGDVNRTYVRGGHVMYARVYRQNTFQRYGQPFSYERLVPAIGFNSAYYAWAARPWSAPVSYRWQWDSEPWHRAYGNDFTPYSNYTSLDEWLTDYMVAQSYRNAYESWQAENAPPVPNGVRGNSAPSAAASGPRPYWDTPDDGQRPEWETNEDRRPYWEEQAAEKAAPQAGEKGTPSDTGAPRPTDAKSNSTIAHRRPSAEDSPAPLSGQMKAELNAQIKRQLAERQTAANPETEDIPDSLKPGHTLFRVNNPLDVPAKESGELCSLRANDYIERTGDMDQNGMVPVKVKVGHASDCAIGFVTQVSVNDLEAMESEQQQALTNAMVAASNNMGKDRGLPQAPAATPVYLAAGQTRPASDATQTLNQLR